jgi:hypothetical protein
MKFLIHMLDATCNDRYFATDDKAVAEEQYKYFSGRPCCGWSTTQLMESTSGTGFQIWEKDAGYSINGEFVTLLEDSFSEED